MEKGKAIDAVAHKMLEAIFAMRARNENYSEERPERTHAKLTRMRSKARELPTRDVEARYRGLAPRTATTSLGASG